MNTLSIATSLGLLTAWQALAQEGDPERGKAAAAVCVACHQPDGSGRHVADGESWPRLAGLNADYIANQLHDYKEGRRRSASMQPFANMLDDQQIVDVAANSGQLPEPLPGRKVCFSASLG